MIPNNFISAAAFTPNSLQHPNAWVGHLPFAAWVIQEVSPKIFVELGTHSGNSYFSFCQSVVEAGLSTKCYAVDTWQGDEHAGQYGDEIFANVNAHHHERYAGFSRLLRMTFDDAASYFVDESIELLHIDGLHTYEAVRHDFETWLPKLAPGAVVMFHDTNVRERNFGVWKLWEELQACYPNNLEFAHSHGLGVLQLNNAPDGKKLDWLQPNSPEKQRLINYFASLGSRQLERFELNELKQQAASLNQAATARDEQIDCFNQALAERDGQIASLNQAATARDEQIDCFNQALDRRTPSGLQTVIKASGEMGIQRRFRLIVPFYMNPQLVRPLYNSLLDCVEELNTLNVRILFYNDSPGDVALHEELSRCLIDRGLLDITVVNNHGNLGFVGTVNLAFEAAIEAREDVLLLNSDTCVFPGAILEIFQVAYSDPMIGFVSPRSNNATLCTLPHGSELLELTPIECFSRFQAVSHHLPRISYVPTAVGFCLFIKCSIISEIGGFDIRYGKGYNEENDLIMRANRLGYRAVLANHAFVWHQGEQSFGALDISRSKRDEINAKLLNSRYPEYPVLVRNYFSSAEYQAEGLLGALCPDAESRLKIGFDLSSFGTYHNGTFEAGKKLLYAAAQFWPDDIELVVFMSRQSWDFHQLEACSRVRWADTHRPGEKLAAIVRMGQPFDANSLSRMLVRTPVVAVFMLDTIAADCGYLKIEFDEALWHFTMRWSNVIFTNSVFTAEQFRRRYRLGEQTLMYPSLHSVTPSEYVQVRSSAPGAVDRIDVPSEIKRSGGVLVIGNKFEHKALISTVDQLAIALPTLKIIALGCGVLDHKNVIAVQSGSLSDDEIDAIYSGVDAIIFPSHYEGFGFPILHALVRKKPIYLRRLPVFEEIVLHIQVGRENIRWFESTRELVEKIGEGAAVWIGPNAVGENDGWRRSANEVLRVLEQQIKCSSSSNVADRLRWFELAFRPSTMVANKSQGEIERTVRFISGLFERLLEKALSNRIAFNIVKLIWRCLRVLRK